MNEKSMILKSLMERDGFDNLSHSIYESELVKLYLFNSELLYESEALKLAITTTQGTLINENTNIQYVPNASTSSSLYFNFPSLFSISSNKSECHSNLFKMENEIFNTKTIEGIKVGDNGWCSLRINSNRLSENSVNGLKFWLKENPIILINKVI